MTSEEPMLEVDVTIPRELYTFLMGEGPMDGTWFGEMNKGLRGSFWWRALLAVAERESSRLASIGSGAGDVREALEHDLDRVMERENRFLNALEAIVARATERDVKWAGMTARDIALAALKSTDTGSGG